MKKILVATDFSKAADNAVEYAAHLAHEINAGLIVFHAYAVPVVVAEAPVLIPSLEEVEDDSEKRIMKTKKHLTEKYKHGLSIEDAVSCGFAVDEIKKYVETHRVDLVIMGMHGLGAVGEKIIGSTTTSLMAEIKTPVLCMHEKNTFSAYKKIVFACDFGDFKNTKIFEPIKEFVNLFHAKLFILNVFHKSHSEPTITEAVASLRLDQVLANVNHQLCYVENKDVIAGINQFVHDNHIDLVIMMPRSHSFIDKLFKEPHTKKLAFHSHVPIMAIHE
jgi:nucleotide-binding universal stress UspA family protein